MGKDHHGEKAQHPRHKEWGGEKKFDYPSVVEGCCMSIVRVVPLC